MKYQEFVWWILELDNEMRRQLAITDRPRG